MVTKANAHRPILIAGAAIGLIFIAVGMAEMRLHSRWQTTPPDPVAPVSDPRSAMSAHLDGGSEPEAISPEARLAGVDESWWQKVSADLERQEYSPSLSDEGLEAPNRAQNLRTTFGDGGIEVFPRTAKDASPAWRFAWQTKSFGRPGVIEEVAPSTPSAAGARVIYERDGWSEWYENTPKGLEQGFSIERRPGGEGPLQIAGTFPAELRPELRADGAVDFLDANQACVLRYGELHVWDDTGRELPSELILAGTTLAIQIDDRDATYPILVDPLMTSPAWSVESNQLAGQYGWSVGTAGDVNGDGYSDVIIGTPFFDNGDEDEGRAYVYHGSASGLAIAPAWITEGNAFFGGYATSVATAGDVNGDGFDDVIVGAQFIPNGPMFRGAFVYHGSPAGLSATPNWIAENAQSNASFGGSVGSAGDVNGDGYDDVVIGAPDYDNGQTDEGQAFVYHGSATGLAAAPAWTGESNQASSSYGWSVATAGDVNADGFADVIVGAWAYDNNSEPNQGRAFVYHGSPSGLAAAAAWTGESGQQGSNFGRSVGNAGDVNGDGYADVIVGAVRFSNGQSWEGRAYAYHGSVTGLGATPAWTVESDQVGAEMGNAVAAAGDVNGDGFSDVVVGVHQYDNGQSNEGRAYLYQGSANGLGTFPAWANEIDQGAYGSAVGSAGDVNGDGYSDVIIGAFGYGNGQAAEGAAFVYHGSGNPLATSPSWFAESNQGLASFGCSVATAGDINGDGYSDVIVGARQYDNGSTNEGRAYVYQGSSAGLAATPTWTVESNQEGANLGTTVGTAGDVNGDGYSDVIVCAFGFDNEFLDEGRVSVYHGSPAGLPASPSWIAEGNQAECFFGASAATAGDVNGDGYSDVIIGANSYSNGQSREGRALAFHGSSTGLSVAPSWIFELDQQDAFLGTSVSSAGDVNGDRYSDVIVGSDSGRALAFHGAPAGLSAVSDWSIQMGGAFGGAVGTAGDVNGDGYSDVIIGQYFYSNGENAEGRALVYNGSGTGLAMTPSWTIESNRADAVLGFSVSTAGDVNGDGYSDVVVGAPQYDNGIDFAGRVYVYHGSVSGLGSSWIMTGNVLGALLGNSVGTAGDVNGDGFSDIIVGAVNRSNGEPGEGRAQVHLGNAGDGLDRIARQTHTDGPAPIWALGSSDSDTAFRLRALGRTPAGRGNVQLQLEVKPAGVPFNGTGLVTGPIANTGAPGASGSVIPLTELASGLTPETLYHWRLRILTDSPHAPRSPWLWLPYNAVTEADVRTGEATSAVAEGESPAADLRLGLSAPNPFTATTQFEYTLGQGGRHRLTVYDVQGRQVALLAEGVRSAGRYTGRWDGHDTRGAKLPSGIYFLRLESVGRVESQKIVIAR